MDTVTEYEILLGWYSVSFPWVSSTHILQSQEARTFSITTVSTSSLAWRLSFRKQPENRNIIVIIIIILSRINPWHIPTSQFPSFPWTSHISSAFGNVFKGDLRNSQLSAAVQCMSIICMCEGYQPVRTTPNLNDQGRPIIPCMTHHSRSVQQGWLCQELKLQPA